MNEVPAQKPYVKKQSDESFVPMFPQANTVEERLHNRLAALESMIADCRKLIRMSDDHPQCTLSSEEVVVLHIVSEHIIEWVELRIKLIGCVRIADAARIGSLESKPESALSFVNKAILQLERWRMSMCAFFYDCGLILLADGSLRQWAEHKPIKLFRTVTTVAKKDNHATRSHP